MARNTPYQSLNAPARGRFAQRRLNNIKLIQEEKWGKMGYTYLYGSREKYACWTCRPQPKEKRPAAFCPHHTRAHGSHGGIGCNTVPREVNSESWLIRSTGEVMENTLVNIHGTWKRGKRVKRSSCLLQ
jgi:hypothetical protein